MPWGRDVKHFFVNSPMRSTNMGCCFPFSRGWWMIAIINSLWASVVHVSKCWLMWTLWSSLMMPGGVMKRSHNFILGVEGTRCGQAAQLKHLWTFFGTSTNSILAEISSEFPGLLPINHHFMQLQKPFSDFGRNIKATTNCKPKTRKSCCLKMHFEEI